MAAKNAAGSIRAVVLNGILFNVAADSNVTDPASDYEKTSIPHSGGNMVKMMKRSRNKEGIVIIANADERANLKTLADSVDPITLAIKYATHDTDRATGHVHIENWESEENRVTVHLLPDGDWTSSVA